MATPVLIGMPDPISNPDTPTEAPGTPNSTTTTLSTLSTTAIKDGHRGSLAHPHPAFPFPSSASAIASHHHRHPSSHTLEVERADRISRLAGLERVGNVRPTSNPLANAGVSPNPSPGPGNGPGFVVPGVAQTTTSSGPNSGYTGQPPHGMAYFDASGNPQVNTRMSTVGSASATSGPGSAGGRTTWGEAERDGEHEGEGYDGMSVDTNYRHDNDNDDNNSNGNSAMDEDGDGADGMSDRASLVGFGEGAGSTVSGPIYGRERDRELRSPVVGRGSAAALARERERESIAMGGSAGTSGVASPVVDSNNVESAHRIVDSRIDAGHAGEGKPPLGPPEGSDGLGKFYFEEKR